MNARNHFLPMTTAAIFLFAAAGHSRASTWANLYGGPGYDEAVAGTPTADGGCILGGHTQSFNLGPEYSSHAWLVKLAESGRILWQKAYPNVEKEGYTVRDVNPTAAGGYIVAGTAITYYAEDGPMSQSYGWLVKLGGDGAVLWQKGYKDTEGYGASFAAAKETPDGGFIAVGEGRTLGTVTPQSRLWVVRTDAEGNILWQAMVHHENIAHSAAHSVCQTNDGGFIVAGALYSGVTDWSDGYDIWVLKFSGEGDVQWHAMYRGSSGYDIAWAVAQTTDGGYVIGGQTGAAVPNEIDGLVVKLNSQGVIEWQKRYESGISDQIGTIDATSDGGYIVGGLYQGGGVAAKLDAAGAIAWQRLYAGNAIASIHETGAGYVMVSGALARRDGAESHDALVMNTDHSGAVEHYPPQADATLEVSDASLATQNFELTVGSPTLRIITTLCTATDTDAGPVSLTTAFASVDILRTLGDGAGGRRGLFEVDVEAPPGKTVTVAVPTVPTTVYELAEDSPGEYEYFVNDLTGLPELDAVYPQGDYVLRLYADAGRTTLEEELTVTFGDGAGGALPFPEQFPVLTQPAPTDHAAMANTLQTYAWNAYDGTPGTATHMALWITGTGEMDEDIADYEAGIGEACAYTPHLNGQAVPEGVFDLELSFHCHQSSRSPRGTPVEFANERCARHTLTVAAANRPPSIIAALPENSSVDTVAEGDLWSFAVTATDPDADDALAYIWHYSLDGGAVWNLMPCSTPEIAVSVPFEAVRHPATTLEGGQLQMRVTVGDAAGAQDSRTWTAMTVQDRNRRPEAHPVAEPTTWGWLAGAGEGQPTARVWAAAVWTGNRMLVWGGSDSDSTMLNTGGVHDPLTGAWQPTGTENAPSGRFGHGAVWTGTHLLVWGGRTDGWSYTFSSVDTGGRYDPVSDLWTPTSQINAPEPRGHHAAVWTGDKMLVWGGAINTGSYYTTATNTGGIYDPANDTWTPMTTAAAPHPGFHPAAAWTGSKLLVWGGMYGNGNAYAYNNTGGVYDPDTDTWTPMSTENAPVGRVNACTVWTGSKLLVWGGRNNGGVLGDGGIYDPDTNIWTPMRAEGAPTPRSMDTPRCTVYTGSRMLIFGGVSAAGTTLNDGGFYDPDTDTWTPIQSHPEVSARYGHCAVWTGRSLLVWGGNNGHPDNQVIQNGAEFSPAPTAALAPHTPITGDALTCSVSDDVTDPDAEDVPGLVYEYTWRRNETDFSTRTSALRSDTLEAGTATKGEIWTCAVRVLDTGGAATPSGQPAAVTIGNAGPRLAQVNADVETGTGTAVDLAAIAEDDDGEESLFYEWTTVSAPAGTEPPQFSDTGTNAAKNTRTTVFKTGVYQFQVTVRDAEGLTDAGTVEVVVAPILAAAVVAPVNIEASVHDVVTIAIDSATDQFDDPLPGGSLSGQWQASSDSGNTWSDLPIPAAHAYSRMVANGDNGWQFRCVIDGVPSSTTTLAIKSEDNEPPVIRLQGCNPATVFQGRAYSDAGATAIDVVDGTVPVEVSGTVDTAVPGTCVITYRAADAAGNQATAEREVQVVRPSPVVYGISPPGLLDYEPAQTVTVYGNYFSSDCAVWLSNPGLGIPATAIPTTFLSGGRLAFSKSFAGETGIWQLAVRAVDGRESPPIRFHVGKAPQAVLMVRPDIRLNLDACEVGKTVYREIIVTNVGTAPLNGSAQCGAPFAVAEGRNYSLYPGQSQRLLIGYTPASPGSHDGTLVFGGIQNKTLSLAGTAYAPRPTHGVLWGAVRDGDSGVPVGQVAVVLQGVGAVTAPTGPEAGLYSLRVPGGMGYILQAWDTAKPPRYEPYRQFIHTLPAGATLRQDISLTPRQAGGGVALRDIPVVLVRGSGRNLPWTSSEDPQGTDPLLSEKAYWESLRQALQTASLSEVWDCNEGLSEDRSMAGISGESAFESGRPRLETFVGAKLSQYKAKHGVYPPYLNVVGHGMGGLIVRDWLRSQDYATRQTLTVAVPAPEPDGVDEAVRIEVGKVFMLGVPNGGTPVIGPQHCLPGWASTRSLSPRHLHFEFNPLAPWPRTVELFALSGSGGSASASGYLRNGYFAIQNYFRGMTNGRIADAPNDGLTSFWSSQGTEFQGQYVTRSYRTGSWWTGYRYHYYTVYEVVRRDSFVCDYLADPERNLTDGRLLGRSLDHRQLVTDSGVHAWLGQNLLQAVSNDIAPVRGDQRESPDADPDNMQIVADQTGILAPGQTVHCGFVSDADSTLTVDVWLPDGGTVVLTRPDGTEVSPEDDQVVRETSISEDDLVTHVRHTIGAPADGEWLATLQGGGRTADGAYTVVAAVDSGIVAFPQHGMFFRQFDPAVLLCGLADLSGTTPAVPVGASGTGTVTFPDGGTQTVELFDDGMHGDHAAGDGIFGAVLPELAETGIYRVQYRLDGFHNDGATAFQRVAGAEFAVKPGTGLIAGVDGHGLIDSDGDGQADLARLDCRILAAESAAFILRGTLTDASGMIEVHAESPSALLPEGDSGMTLIFDLTAFAEAGTEGQLSVENLQLFTGDDGSPSWTDTYGDTYAVTLGPVLEQQPLGQPLVIGQPATFAVSATGAEPLRYQWRKDGVDLADDGHFAGTQTAVLAIGSLQAGDAGTYTVVVTDLHWSATSQPAVLGDDNPPLSASVVLMPPTPDGNSLAGAVAFSTPVIGFSQESISVKGGTVSNFTARDEANFSFEITASTGSPAVVVQVPAAVARNAVGILNQASNAVAVMFLEAGWNAISLPLQPDEGSPAVLFARDDGAGAGYLGSIWQWIPVPDGIGGFAETTALEAFRGYCVCMRFPTALVIEGGMPDAPTASLGRGWNLFGFAGTITAPVHPDAAAQCWAYGDDGFQSAQSLQPGAAYWIYMWSSADVNL